MIEETEVVGVGQCQVEITTATEVEAMIEGDQVIIEEMIVTGVAVTTTVVTRTVGAVNVVTTVAVTMTADHTAEITTGTVEGDTIAVTVVDDRAAATEMSTEAETEAM